MSNKVEGRTQEVEIDRMFNLVGAFDDKMADDFLNFCLDIEAFDAEYSHQFPNNDLTPIVININSNGGNVDALMAMLDALELVKAPVIARVLGRCCSCALFFYVHADLRTCGSNSEFLYHNVLYNTDLQPLFEHEILLKKSQQLQKRVDEQIIEHTNITQKQLTAHRKEDWWFGKEEAIELGVVNFDGHQGIVYDIYYGESEGDGQ